LSKRKWAGEKLRGKKRKPLAEQTPSPNPKRRVRDTPKRGKAWGGGNKGQLLDRGRGNDVLYRKIVGTAREM